MPDVAEQAVDGFAELARHDQNADGIIDARDSVFDTLRLLHDVNGDGQVGRDELSTLAEAGIQSLDLRHYTDARDDQHGNTIAQRSSFTRADGTTSALADAWLAYRG